MLVCVCVSVAIASPILQRFFNVGLPNGGQNSFRGMEAKRNIRLVTTLVIKQRSHRLAWMCVVWLKRQFRDAVVWGNFTGLLCQKLEINKCLRKDILYVFGVVSCYVKKIWGYLGSVAECLWSNNSHDPISIQNFVKQANKLLGVRECVRL